jgi:hypothetical protein
VLRHNGRTATVHVVTEDRRQEFEQAMHALLERERLPAPDEVEHRENSIVLLWHDEKLAVVIDLD